MTYQQWQERYKPLKNVVTEDAPFGGFMYESVGEEHENIYDTNHKKVWTLIEEEGKLLVVPGYQFVNKVGYFITEESWETELHNDFEVALEE